MGSCPSGTYLCSRDPVLLTCTGLLACVRPWNSNFYLDHRPSDTISVMTQGIYLTAMRTLFIGATMLLLAGLAHPALAQGDHVGQYAQADIEYGLRLYRTTCVACHAESGAGVPGTDISSATPRAQTDFELAALIRNGVEGTAMPPGEYADSEVTALVAYVRTMAELDASNVQLGDASRGESLVMGKGDCTSCHRLGDAGALGMAPELTAIAASRTAGALQAALLDPNQAMIPINRPVQAVLSDGTVVSGRRMNEDTYTVQLIDDEGQLRSLDKTTLREFTVVEESPMPSYAETLTTQEIADVMSYLLTLRGVEGLD